MACFWSLSFIRLLQNFIVQVRKWSMSFMKIMHAYNTYSLSPQLANHLIFSPKSWQRAAISTHSSSLGGIKGCSNCSPFGLFTGSSECFLFNPFTNSAAMWQTLHRDIKLCKWSYLPIHTLWYPIECSNRVWTAPGYTNAAPTIIQRYVKYA